MFFEKFNIICIGINYIQNYDDKFRKIQQTGYITSISIDLEYKKL